GRYPPKNPEDNAIAKASADALRSDLAHIQPGKSKGQHRVAKQENPEMAVEIGLSAPECLRFHVGILHQDTVPEEPEGEEENKRHDQRDYTSFMIHVSL